MDMVRLLLVPGIAGAIAGLGAAGLMLALDVGALRTLLLSGPNWLAAAMLAFAFMATFSSAAIGAAVMALGRE